MVTEIGKYLREVRIKTGDSLRTMATKLGISAAYLSAIENGKRNVPTDFLKAFFLAYSIPENEKKSLTQSLFYSINNIKVDLSNLSDKKRQVLLSVTKEELDDSTVDKLCEIISMDANNKTEKF